jgi:Fic family protein
VPTRYHLGSFPPRNLDLVALVPRIGRAQAALARYDGLLAAVPNARLLFAPLTVQEAVLSSKIEGTQVTVGEVLEADADGDAAGLTMEKRADIEEVRSYRSALGFIAEAIAERPLSEHLLRETHALLMRGVRGGDKDPGSYRADQNWIGAPGCTVEDASFVPIAPEHLGAGMNAWAQYVNDETQPDPIVQLAIAHVEFEALHPFRDGNGRLGRMLIPLFLFRRGLLASPSFYMSGYFERRRDMYIDRLRAVSSDGAWTAWCSFFLDGVADQAGENERKVRAILALYERVKADIIDVTHSQYGVRALDFIFRQPVFRSAQFVAGSDIPRPTAQRFIALLRDAGLLHTARARRGRRGGVYVFTELIEVVEGRTLR